MVAFVPVPSFSLFDSTDEKLTNVGHSYLQSIFARISYPSNDEFKKLEALTGCPERKLRVNTNVL